jgi:hypothetical protein
MKKIKTAWGIRHIRFYFKMVALNLHVDRCRKMGMGYHASQNDEDYMDAVWRGEK